MTPPETEAAATALAEALAAAQRREWEAAFSALEQALAIAPGALEVHLARGRILRAKEGESGAAIRAFKRAAECDGPPLRRAEALAEYGRALHPIGRHAAAGAAFEEAIDLVRAAAEAGEAGLAARVAELMDLASRAHERDGDLEAALERHRGAEPHYRTTAANKALHLAREATLLEELGRYAELFDCYRRLVELDPDRVLFAQADARRTQSSAKRLKALLGGINQYLAEHRYDLVALVFKAGFFYRLARYRQAERLLLDALEHGAEHFYALHLLGKVRLKTGRKRAALAVLRQAAAMAPPYYDLQRDLALALELAGRKEEALEVYRSVETRWPGRTQTLARAARLRERMGLVEEAYESYRRLAAQSLPPDPALLAHLAELALGLDRPVEASRHLEEALGASAEGTPEHANLCIRHAQALEAAGGAEDALGALEAVIAGAAERGLDGIVRVATLEKAALLHGRLGRAEDALDVLQRMLERDPGDVEALTLFGDALKSSKRFAESVEYYARAADQRLSDALLDEGLRLCEGQQYERAIGKLNEAFHKSPASWEIYYCAAAAYARLGEAGPASKYLEAAVRHQTGALALMEKDGDFDRVREAPAIRELCARQGGGAA